MRILQGLQTRFSDLRILEELWARFSQAGIHKSCGGWTRAESAPLAVAARGKRGKGAQRNKWTGALRGGQALPGRPLAEVARGKGESIGG